MFVNWKPQPELLLNSKIRIYIVGFWHVAGLKVLKHFRIRKNTA